MTHSSTLTPDGTALIVVDIQEAFRTAIPDFAVVASNSALAVRGCRLLGLPVIVTEQYPKGLGHTAEEIMLSFDEEPEVFEKTAFSAFAAAGLPGRLAELNIKNILLCGLETHICVNQTAHDLLAAGFGVHLLAECVGSRYEHDKAAGKAKMFGSGVIASSVEMALFEMMRDAKHPQFKDIQALIK